MKIDINLNGNLAATYNTSKLQNTLSKLSNNNSNNNTTKMTNPFTSRTQNDSRIADNIAFENSFQMRDSYDLGMKSTPNINSTYNASNMNSDYNKETTLSDNRSESFSIANVDRALDSLKQQSEMLSNYTVK